MPAKRGKYQKRCGILEQKLHGCFFFFFFFFFFFQKDTNPLEMKIEKMYISINREEISKHYRVDSMVAMWYSTLVQDTLSSPY